MTTSPVHVEISPHRQEAVMRSCRWRCARRGGGEVRPGLADGVKDVQIAEEGCASRGESDFLWAAAYSACNIISNGII